MAKEDANLAVSDQAGLVADAESESYKLVKSNDAEDAFVAVSQGEHEFRFGCSGRTEGLSCEIGLQRTICLICRTRSPRHHRRDMSDRHGVWTTYATGDCDLGEEQHRH